MEQPKANHEEKKTVRVTLDLSPGSNERLESLQKRVNARSKADVLRDALRLYEWAVDSFTSGGDFYVRTPTGEIERALPLTFDKM